MEVCKVMKGVSRAVFFLTVFFSVHGFAIPFEVGRGAYFLPDKMPRSLQQDVYSIRGYISAVMEKIRTHGVSEATFPGSEDIPLPTITSVPVSEVLYASFSQGGSDPSGAFIITIGETNQSRSGIHDFVLGARFRFDPQVVGDQIAQWQCYTDLENMGNLYPGHVMPEEGSGCSLLENLGEVFTGCIHYDGDNAILNPTIETENSEGWMSVYS